MTSTAQLFETKLSAFKENQNAPWGRLRYDIAFANVSRHLDGKLLQVLDAGGGNGLDAIPFAAQGHPVAVLDYSTEMLAEARRNAEANHVVERMTFHQADLKSISTLFSEAQFDLILCHNVLQYVDEVTEALDVLCRALRPGGLISLICVNRYSESYRLALMQMNFEAAQAHLDATTIMSNVFGVPVHVYSGEELGQFLQQVGCSVLGQYGLLCVCGYIPNNDIKYDPAFFAHLERLEQMMTDKYPYYLLGRYTQVIARKG